MTYVVFAALLPAPHGASLPPLTTAAGIVLARMTSWVTMPSSSSTPKVASGFALLLMTTFPRM